MKPIDCEFEADALAAAIESRWPEGAEAELRAHVAGCPVCADVIAVASAVAMAANDEREEVRASALIPDSGAVWWRAQLRARREAAEAAGRPITAAQLVAFATAVGLLGACFGATSTWFQSSFARIVGSVRGADAKTMLQSAFALLAQHAALALGTALMLCAVSAAVYLVVGRD